MTHCGASSEQNDPEDPFLVSEQNSVAVTVTEAYDLRIRQTLGKQAYQYKMSARVVGAFFLSSGIKRSDAFYSSVRTVLNHVGSI